MPVSTFSADGWITGQSVPVTTNTPEPFDYLDSAVTNLTEEEAQVAFVGEPINPVARIVFLVAAWTMAIVGVVGSSSLLYVIHKYWGKSNHNVFIASLTFANLLILGYWLPFLCVDLMVGFHPVADHFHCQANAVISVTLSLVYVTSLIMVTLNRFMLVCHAQLYEQCFSPKTTVLGVIALWVGSIVSATIPVYGMSGLYAYDAITRTCTFKKLAQGYVCSLFTVLYFAVPLCLIGFFNFRIYRFWNRANVKLVQRCSTIDPPCPDCPTGKGSVSLQEKGVRQTQSASELSPIDEKSIALSIEDSGIVQTPKRTCCKSSSTCHCASSSPTDKFTIPAAAGTFLYDSLSGKTTRRSVLSVGSSCQPRQTEIESSPDPSTPNTPVPRAVKRKPGPSRCRTPSSPSPSYCTKLRRPSTSTITSASDPKKKRNSSSTDSRTEISKRTKRSSAEPESESVKTFSIPESSKDEPGPQPNVLPFLALTQERDDVSFKSRADSEDADSTPSPMSSLASSTFNPRAKSLWLAAGTGAHSGCSSATASCKGSVKTVEESSSPGCKNKKEESKASKKSSLAKGNRNKNAYVNMDFFREDPSNLGGSLSSDVHIHPTYHRPCSMMMLHYQAPETWTQSEGTEPQQSQTTRYQEITIDRPNDHISMAQHSQKMRILDSDVDSSMCGQKRLRISTGSLPRSTSATFTPNRTSLQFLAFKRRLLGSRDSGRREHSAMEQRIAAVTKRIEKREMAVVRSLLAVSLLAAIAFIPYGAVHLVGQFVDFPPELYISVNLFFCLNAALNWVVYGVMNPCFRDSYRNMFHRLFHVCAEKEKSLHPPGPKVSVHSSLSPEHVRDTFNTPALSALGFRSRFSVNIGIRGIGSSPRALSFPAGEVYFPNSCVDCDNCGQIKASPSVGTKI